MNEPDKLLIELLAATDALWRPDRAVDATMPTASTLAALRLAFPKSGVPFSGHGAERRGRQGVVATLAKRGLLATSGRGKGVCAKLTEAGDLTARALTNNPLINETWAMMRRVAKLACESECGLLTPETGLGGTKYGEPDCMSACTWIEWCLLPGVLRGWCTSRSDREGRVYYSLTATGVDVAAADVPTLPPDLPPVDEEAERHYIDAVIEARQRYRNMDSPNPSEAGPPCLPVSLELRKHKAKK